MRGLMRWAKSARSRNGSLAARRDDRLDRLLADALHRGERIEDRPSDTSKSTPERLMLGRIDLDAEPQRLAAEFRELVGVAERSSVIDAARNSTG
jgi:hypothetical protein